MTPALRRLIAVERHELGVEERPHGSNNVKYNTAYYGHPVHNVGKTNFAWCVVFQWWCFQRAGIPTSVFPKSVNVFAVREWYRKKGRFNHTPKVGSLVIFTFSHIGLVEKVFPDGRIQTIEGNTDSNGGRTGGRVMRKIRSRQISGYCHPDYTRVPVVRPAPRPVPHPVPRPAARPGVRPAGQPTLRPATKAATAPTPTVSVAPPKARTTALPVRTAVQAGAVVLPAGRFTAVQFGTATANTGGFWRPPEGPRRGYNLVTGPGVYVSDITVEAPELPETATLQFRLVQADPGDHYRIVVVHPPGEISGPGGVTRHTTVLSSLGPGHHVWVQLRCDEAVVVPLVRAEVVLLAR